MQREEEEEEDDFEANVRADELQKARALEGIRDALRDRVPVSNRSSSPHVPFGSYEKLAEYPLVRKNSYREKMLNIKVPVNETTAVEAHDVETADLFDFIPEPYPHSEQFRRLVISETSEPLSEDTKISCRVLKKCLDLRKKWISLNPKSVKLEEPMGKKQTAPAPPISSPSSANKPKFRRREDLEYNVFDRPLPPSTSQYAYRMVEGVMQVYDMDAVTTSSEDFAGDEACDGVKSLTVSDVSVLAATSFESKASCFTVLSFKEFVADFSYIKKAAYTGSVASFAHHRLELLAAKFHLHILLNGELELTAQKSVPHRDFYNVRKVDTHVHHSASMNQKHLLRFIKHKLKTAPEEVVAFRDGRYLTLGEVFKSLGLTAYDLSIDTLDMHAHDTFHRFDKFNLKYNPAGQSRLREIFLKTDNLIEGRYLAEITKEMFSDLEASKYQLVEWRISIYGRKVSEWRSLSKWFYDNRLAHKNIRWMIQIPRLFQIYRKAGEVKSFGEMLNNIFAPLFEVTLNPAVDPQMFLFLETVVGFDSVDDESRPESGSLSPHTSIPGPDDWTNEVNPPYAYWMYYMFANICVLNQLRAARGMTTFSFRPHCGEAGDISNTHACFLVANHINHGIVLRNNSPTQYLYYLSQIGIAMSPLSNNKLFLDFNKNPFPKYFRQGLNVSLSTDDPLMLHYTKDALVEEYSVATQVWKFSPVDQCEIARNSVLQSGWEDYLKLHYLGANYSDIRETNVPPIRLKYRLETLNGELNDISKYSEEYLAGQEISFGS